MATPSKKMQNLPLIWYFQNPICLTFCSVTRSIFHVGWKVRWVSESKFRGLSNGNEKFLCMCSRNWENNKNKVGPMIWDTLYNIWHKNIKFTKHFTFHLVLDVHLLFLPLIVAPGVGWVTSSPVGFCNNMIVFNDNTKEKEQDI